MCGIFGYSAPLSTLAPEERTLLGAALGMLNDDRGGDSWGAYILNEEKKIVRGLGKVATGLAWPALLRQAHVLMGHTRKATIGTISVDNAHPFEVGNIVGAHNGHISNHEEMNKKYARAFSVDSMHIFAHIQKGWKLSELTGWGAIEYTNQKKWPDRINLCKVSSGGDLSIAAIDARVENNTVIEPKAIVWSSLERHLTYALDMAGLGGRYTLYKIEEGVIYSIHNGQLFTQKRKLQLGIPSYNNRSAGFCGSSRGFTQYNDWDGDPGRASVVGGDYDVYFKNNAKFYVDRTALLLSLEEEKLEAEPPVVVDGQVISEDPAVVNDEVLKAMNRTGEEKDAEIVSG